MEDLSKLADIVYKLGFPIFVAIYLLVRVDRVISELLKQNSEMLGLLRDVRTALFVRSVGVDRHVDPPVD